MRLQQKHKQQQVFLYFSVDFVIYVISWHQLEAGLLS